MFGISTLSARTAVLALVILIIVIVALVIGARTRAIRKPKSTNSTITSWKAYLKLQGVVLCGFLFLGAALAWLSSFWGPVKGQITRGGKLIEYRNLDLSQHPVYEEVDTEHYSGITIFTKTTAPEKGAAIVTIYRDGEGPGKGEISRIESVADSWSRWDQQNPNKHISITIRGAEQTGATPATQADIMVYLSPK